MRILLFLFLTLLCASAQERILSYDSEIRVGKDGFLDVVETIRVNVEGDEIRRGIYRDFPQNYVTNWGLRQWRPFEVTEVMRNGAPEPFELERMVNGTRVRIGSADVLLETGSEQEYTIAYRTGRQLLSDEQGDELYWNVTGNFWNFPIDEARAKVILPKGIPVTLAEAYTGPSGSEDRNYEKTDEPYGVSFRTTSSLGKGEGLTVVVRWEPGKLDAPAYETPPVWKGNIPVLLGLALVVTGLLAFTALWFMVGRDPARGVIVPGWEPPVGFSAAAVRYLRNMKFDDTCFTTAVISLASKGFLKIVETKSDAYKVVRKEGGESMAPEEDSLFRSLFAKGGSLKLEQTNHARIGEAKLKLATALHDNLSGRYFHNNTGQWMIGLMLCIGGLAIMTQAAEDTMATILMMLFAFVMGIWIAVLLEGMRRGGSKVSGCLILTIPGVLAGFVLLVIGDFAGIWFAFATLLVSVAAPLFHALMKAPTKAGRAALDTIAGFREYLSVAEEDRLNLENPPERTPELFERFLPYALALEVEQAWSEKFDAVLAAAGRANGDQDYTPSFYTGGSSGFGNALTGAGIGAAVGGALATSSVAPSSSGSSGGSSGGGSSGGGGGGGGGGGW